MYQHVQLRLHRVFLSLQVLEELDVGHIPMVSVWNKVDVCTDPVMVQTVADKREGTVCISAQTGQGLPELLRLIEGKIQESMLAVDVVVPYAQVRPFEMLVNLQTNCFAVALL